MTKRSKWSLIGIPDHQGILNVGGRIGAAGAPAAFRRSLAKMKDIHPLLAEDLTVTGMDRDVARNHRRAADVIRDSHKRFGLSVVVGGGHDHGYSHLLGVSEALGGRLGCINIDAHLDVRKPNPEITSGSPFYLALETQVILPCDLIEFGIQRQCNGTDLWKYIDSKGVPVVRFESLRHGRAAPAFSLALEKLSQTCDAIIVSFDIDAVAAAFAPGVSAPQAEGFSPSDILEMMEISGAAAKVGSLGLFELNPEHDPDQRTALLAATAAHRFIVTALSDPLAC